MKCRICGSTNLKKFLSLGITPLANSFLLESELNNEEKKFPLEVCFCQICKLVQLTEVVPPETMFRNYLYVSSTTATLKAHFMKMAEDISKEFNLGSQSVAVDVGSNDGLLLAGFQKIGVKSIGVEPASNLAKIANQNGLDTINDFFNEISAMQIIKKAENVDVVTATNVFAHVNNIRDFAKNVKTILNNDGIFAIEIQYFVNTIEQMTFDNIYHEHLSYFTLTSLVNFFRLQGMEVFKAQRINTHGGSLRVFVRMPDGNHMTDESIALLLNYEKNLGIDKFETLLKFAEKVYKARSDFIKYIKDIKSKGKTIIGYGAPAKANTLLNFCGIGKESIDWIVEDNLLKQGLYGPGTHIPIVSPKMLDEKKPDYILIFAWNFADEILKKTKKYAGMGVKFIIPLPEPRIV